MIDQIKGNVAKVIMSVFKEIAPDAMIEFELTGEFPEWHRMRTAYCWGAVAAYRCLKNDENPYEDTNNWGHTWYKYWQDGFDAYLNGEIDIEEYWCYEAAHC